MFSKSDKLFLLIAELILSSRSPEMYIVGHISLFKGWLWAIMNTVDKCTNWKRSEIGRVQQLHYVRLVMGSEVNTDILKELLSQRLELEL